MPLKCFYYISLAILISLVSCKKTNRFALNDKEINTDIAVSIQRFDSALITLDTVNIEYSVNKLYADFPRFTPPFIENILDENPEDKANVAQLLQNFLSDTIFRNVNQKALATYQNVNTLEKDLTAAFNFLNHYFPRINTPEVYFFVSDRKSTRLNSSHT